MDTTTSDPGPIDDEWVERHFDHLSPALARELHPTLARARSLCPVAHSDQYGGFWVATQYEDVLRIAQDWQTFSSELGITVPHVAAPMKSLPVGIDPPLQRTFRRVINPYFRPSVVSEWEQRTRELVNGLIDGFIAAGECDFMTEFARPLPGLAFFDLALHAPTEDLEEVNHYATMASLPHLPESRECLGKLSAWIGRFIARRRGQPARGDVVDAVINAEIEGRPITEEEAIGTIQLLILGGLETTAGVLGMAMLRFCKHPEIPALLRARPELIPTAVEELLRLDGSFICIARTARHDTELAGHQIKAGERVLLYWASANRDEAEFDDPDDFDLDRARNRHIAFGAGPHRCAGSNLARMNLRIALDEIVRRLHDIRLRTGTDIDFHSTFNRAPLSVPISFTPGAPAHVSSP
ncbi:MULTISPECIES: cytochrome P450 [unclassified Pseudofrankia]|uniref:cytochrome P450 n=1 Tax=unclassified Pseudofrankia TaxID=2994372 RepID=UPI0008DA3E75|nr:MULTISPECIES: cytochrome P450 [unclassified Pseudofrankia]MDT3445782.1 cytochrome P450 [Pseudofrankia sp. BMG5.37]OHV62788.1 cytochrome [Pseudofrankia sp. BMG5.36]